MEKALDLDPMENRLKSYTFPNEAFPLNLKLYIAVIN